MGYEPKIIVPYRSPLDVGRSFLTQGYRNWAEEREQYLRINRNAAIFLYSFGGCAIEAAELTNPNETDWATALAKVTGLECDALLAAREKRVASSKHGRSSASGPPSDASKEPKAPGDPDSEAVYQALRALKGRVLPTSRQAERRFAYGRSGG
jgi:hypothetical protein